MGSVGWRCAHGTCGLNNPWHRTCGRCHNWVVIPGRPPYVTPSGSAGLKKQLIFYFLSLPGLSLFICVFVIVILGVSKSPLYVSHCFKISLLLSALLCSTSLFAAFNVHHVQKDDDISLAGKDLRGLEYRMHPKWAMIFLPCGPLHQNMTCRDALFC